MLGTGYQRLHDERRSQRIVKIARDRHQARRQARGRPGAARPHSIGPEHAVRGRLHRPQDLPGSVMMVEKGRTIPDGGDVGVKSERIVMNNPLRR